MTIRFPPEPTRRAFFSAIPSQPIQFGDTPPDARFLYVPRSHARALSFDTALVQGIRGSGKSLWWAALQKRQLREIVSMTLGAGTVDVDAEVTAGFGKPTDPNAFPGPDTLQHLFGRYDARDIWWSVVFSAALDEHGRELAPPFKTVGSTWAERIEWLVKNPELRERIVFTRDQELSRAGRRKLILFDALEYASPDWRKRNVLIHGLLRLLLDLRACTSIRGKAFVRPDMLSSADVTSFPDASKIVTNDVRLGWPRNELYNLLWQHLANAPDGGEIVRQSIQSFGPNFCERGGVWYADASLGAESVQQRVFHAISGPYMGRDRRRGLPYTWLPNHLADAHGQVSPRSFLAALRRAAESPSQQEGYAVSYQSIKEGVQAASEIRVVEVVEDFPWSRPALEALSGLVLPCEFTQVEERWREADLLLTFQRMERQPERLNEGFPGIRRELEALGFFARMVDGRVNMPDVYRVGFGLRRKGGVRPVR